MSGPDTVLTLDQLSLWPHAGTALAVLGHPVAHSLSPALHNAALANVARRDREFVNWNYFKFDVPPADLPEALRRLHAAGFLGLNLTVPHKVIAFDQVDEIDPDAVQVGAVNTLRRTSRGWRGCNTDGYGLAAAIRTDLAVALAGSPVILLGAGGAARAAAVECLRHRCAGLWIGNRTAQNLDPLLGALLPLAGATGVSLRGFSPSRPPADLPAGALVINATSLGLHEGDPASVELSALPHPAAVFDMIYNPPETALLHAAAALGIPHANGLSMLVHQGAKSLEIWSGIPAAQTAPVMQAAALTVLAER